MQTGESLWSISRAYDVDVRSLASWNSMAPGDVLSVGPRARRLDRRAGADRGWRHGAGIARSARIRRRASRRPTAFARSPTSCAAAIRLSSIARRFKVSVGKLVEWNTGAADKYLQPGQRLKMFVDVTEQSG